MKVKSLSHAQLLATPWTAAYQAPPSMGFSRQEYWSRVPLPSPKGKLNNVKNNIKKKPHQITVNEIESHWRKKKILLWKCTDLDLLANQNVLKQK